LTFTLVGTVFYLGSPDPRPDHAQATSPATATRSACLSVTSAASAFTRNQVVCFIVSVCSLCVVLTLDRLSADGHHVRLTACPRAGWIEFLANAIAYTSFMDHFYDMTKGIVSARDIVYFLSVIVDRPRHHRVQAIRVESAPDASVTISPMKLDLNSKHCSPTP